MTKTSANLYDVMKVREDFPILKESVHGKPLIYLDNANTTQKPQIVIDAITQFYTHYNSNIHRANHALSERATGAYEGSRVKVCDFLNASSTAEIVFVRNATEGINLVAATWGWSNIQAGDEILVSAMEHHANIVPWQMLCERKGASLKVIPIFDNGEIDLEAYEKALNPKTKLVGIVHMSNALGTINPVKRMIEIAHKQGIPVLVDGAQSAYHKKIDVQDLDCEFFVFSGHKLYGPTGIGVLYGKKEFLEAMPPYQGGGDMISKVTFEKTVYNELPHKFEAGTPHIAGGIGLGVAIDYLTCLGMENIEAYESELMAYGTEVLTNQPGLRMIGTAKEKASVYSFTLADIHPEDVGLMLDAQGIAIRTGQHCAHPVMQRYGIQATCRASLGCYNTKAEIDALANGLTRIKQRLS